MRETREVPDIDEFAAAVRRSVAAGEIAGAAVSLTCRERIRMECYGVQNVVSREPVRLDTIFRIGSCAKALFATALLRLVEERGLSLDRSVEEWVPELADRRVLRTPASDIEDTVPVRRAITLYDVLTFQLGTGVYLHPQDTPLYRAMRASGVAPQREPVSIGPDEFAARLAALPLAHQPGETFMYHLGDDVVRLLIGRMTGQALDEAMRERVFEPLGMSDTGCFVPADKRSRFSTCYFSQSEAGAVLAPWDEPDGRFAEEPIFPNQLMSTTIDFAKFATMMLDDGRASGRAFLQPETVAMMTRNHLTREQMTVSPAPPGFWETRGWGMGGSVYRSSAQNGPRDGSYSWFGGYGPHFLIDRRRGAAIVMMIPRVVEKYSDTQLGYAFEAATYRDYLDETVAAPVLRGD